MGQPVKPEQALSPGQALLALQGLAAFVSSHPSPRLSALMAEHGRHRVEATVALGEAQALLRSLGLDPTPWLDAHPGTAAHWPCAEALGMRERVRVVDATHPAGMG